MAIKWYVPKGDNEDVVEVTQNNNGSIFMWTDHLAHGFENKKEFGKFIYNLHTIHEQMD